MIIPCNDSLWVRSAVVTGEYLSHVRISVFLSKIGTVHPGWVTAAFRVYEEFRVRDIPGNGTQRFCHEFLER